MKKLQKEFENPSNGYRPIPFWSWNDKLEEEEIRTQIRELKAGGAGGYFMHARSGLKTEYLSEEWFECISAGIDEGAKQELQAWIYDEEGWPSGFAGGLVPAMSEDYHAKYISACCGKSMAEPDMKNVAFCYALNERTGEYRRISPDTDDTCGENEVLFGVIRHTNPYYVDTLNKRAIEAFLSCTHEEYYKRFGEKFGNAMYGFFTDEPRLTCNNFGDLAWSDDLPDAFLEAYGYDIREHIPALYRACGNYRKVRYDFWRLVSRMFTENYMKTIYDWCEAHQCKVTGHIMMEESIFSQMTSTAGVMPFYEYMHIPGIDWLRRRIDSPVIGKQVGSVACQLGKKQVLTESFALCGWGVSFEELKWIAEWQFVNGVNQICQHLMAYDIKGVRKRDYPPSHFTQQTWWDEAHLFNDYLARLCVGLSYGDQTADVLLLHPMRSGFLAFDGTRTDAIKYLDDMLIRASESLSGQHVSYHYGDETIIEKYGAVEADRFIVGRIGYRTVILPEMYSIDAVTVRLLLAFAENGGTILSLGKLPEYTDGKAEELEKLMTYVEPVDYGKIRKVMEEKGLVSLSIREAEKEVEYISYQQRSGEDGNIYFLANHSQEKSGRVTVEFIGQKGQLYVMQAETGEIQKFPYQVKENGVVATVPFEPMQSWMFYLKTDSAAEGYAAEEAARQEIALGQEWTVAKPFTNALTLDYCDYRVNGGEWQREVPVIKVQDALLARREPCQVELKFRFRTEVEPTELKDCRLVLEDAEKYEVQVNGCKVSTVQTGWWKDKAFRTVSVLPFVKRGQNEITLSILFEQPQKVYDVLFGENVYETEKNKITYGIEIESIYLVGDFGVYSEKPFREAERNALLTEGSFVIKPAPKQFSSLELTQQGCLFLADRIVLSQKMQIRKEAGKRQILKLGRQQAQLVNVYVNGKLVKHSLWAPYEADITEAALEGENEIVLEIFASNRNLLGPHHHIDGECYNVGPESFTGKWSWVERKSEADATDISDRDKSYWTDTYSFIRLGLE